MIYFEDEKIIIRDMIHSDAQTITEEEIAQGWHQTVEKYEMSLGVGVHNGYGSAQRMYGKRGYIPDGTGVWYGEKVCTPYTECCNDDDLILYLSKKLG